MHWRERELYEIIKVGGKIKTSDIISRSRMCKVTALKYLKSLKAAGHVDFEKIGPTKLWQVAQGDGPRWGVGPLHKPYQSIFKILNEFEMVTGKKACIIMSVEDLDTMPVGTRMSLLEDGAPYLEYVEGVKGEKPHGPQNTDCR